MSDTAQQTQAAGGVPWYLWVLIAPVSIAIIIGVIVSQVPEDPEQIYQEALETVDDREQKEEFSAALARLEAYPEYESHVLLLKGMKAAAETRDPRALEYFEKAAENKGLAAIAYRRAAASHAKMGEYMVAIKSYEKSLAEEPDSPETLLMLAQLYYGIGGLTHSISIIDEILEANPEDRTARAMRAREYKDLLDHETALEDFSLLLKTPGDRAAASPETIQGYMECLLAVKDTDRIKEAWSEFGADIPDPVFKKRLQVAAGELEGLEMEIEESKRGQTGPPLDGIEADMLVLEKQFSKAADSVKKAIRYYPRDPAVYETAVVVFRETGEADWLAAAEKNLKLLRDVEKTLTASIQKIGDDSQDGKLRVKVGDQFLKLGLVNRALRWYNVALIVQPEIDVPSMEDVYASVPQMKPLSPLPDAGKGGDDESAGEGGGEKSGQVGNAKGDAAASGDSDSNSDAKTDDPKTDDAKTDDAKTDDAKTDEAAKQPASEEL